MNLAIVGGTTVDLILQRLKRLPAWPTHGEFTRSNLVFLSHGPICTLGGNGANAAYVAGRCGAAVTLHTSLGDDAMGQLARGWLESAGCQVISPNPATTSVNVTAANAKQQRATFYYPGEPNAMPSLSSLRTSLPSHLLVAGWPHPALDDIASSLAVAQKRGIFTSIDVGPILQKAWTLAAMRKTLASLDLFIANEYEIQRITRTDSLLDALTILRRSFSGHVVVKRGRKGAFWLEQASDEFTEFRSHRITAVNTVGAGDSFNGGLLAGLVHGRPFPEAMRYAAKVAASVVSSKRGSLGVIPPAQ